MRSVIVFLKTNDRNQIIAELNSLCSFQSNDNSSWTIEKMSDPVLYIQFYEKEYWCEIEPDGWTKIVNKLSSEPQISISIDASGRHSGKNELFSFLESFLHKFEGIALDDYSNYPWLISEILNGQNPQGQKFFEYENEKEYRSREKNLIK